MIIIHLAPAFAITLMVIVLVLAPWASAAVTIEQPPHEYLKE
ncbi:MAG: hypothetical protein ABIU85_08135 [Methylotenera sp.]